MQCCIHVTVLSLNFLGLSSWSAVPIDRSRLYTLPVPPTVNDELVDLSGASRVLPFPSHIQCYWKTPKVLGYLMDLAIFVFLGLSGLSA